MKEQMLSILRTELSAIRRELTALRQYHEVNDLVNRLEAISILGVTKQTFSVYLSQGKVTAVTINGAGQKFFSERELKGLK